MAIQDGTPVITARGRRVGHIVGIVLDPATGDLSHLIVERGIVFAKPRLVPADAIDEIGPDRITLAEEVDPRRLPLYETERYVEVGGAAAHRTNGSKLTVVPYSPLEPAGAFPLFLPPSPPTERVKVHNIPDHDVAIEMGAEVTSADGHHLGKVGKVLTAHETVTGFVVDRGMLPREERAIPASWIRSFEEGEVHLGVDAGTVERLPAYRT
jgi:uncharacterized protein YrrD